MKTETKIKKLLKIWIEYISFGAHKSRDTYFEITTVYDGLDISCILEYHGYVYDYDILQTYKTYNEALLGLHKLLVKMISREKEWASKAKGLDWEDEEFPNKIEYISKVDIKPYLI